MDNSYRMHIDPGTVRRVSWQAIVKGTISRLPRVDGEAIGQYLRGLRWESVPCEARRARDPGAA